MNAAIASGIAVKFLLVFETGNTHTEAILPIKPNCARSAIGGNLRIARM